MSPTTEPGSIFGAAVTTASRTIFRVSAPGPGRRPWRCQRPGQPRRRRQRTAACAKRLAEVGSLAVHSLGSPQAARRSPPKRQRPEVAAELVQMRAPLFRGHWLATGRRAAMKYQSSDSSACKVAMSGGRGLSNRKASSVTGWRKPKDRGTQGLALQTGLRNRHTDLFRWRSGAVGGVAEAGRADRGQMHTDLVGAAGLERAGDTRRPSVSRRDRTCARGRSASQHVVPLTSPEPSFYGRRRNGQWRLRWSRDWSAVRRGSARYRPGQCREQRRAPTGRGGRRRSWRRRRCRRCPCRCGGRYRVGRPRRCPRGYRQHGGSKALTRVPLSLPGAGWTAMPAGLSTTIRSASSKSTLSGIASTGMWLGRQRKGGISMR